MATRAQQIRLGIFFLVSLAVLALFFIVVAGSHLLRQRDIYYIESNSPVSGLNKGADVKYLGFSIGRVEDIAIAQDNLATVVIEISVERRLAENAIRTDTQARMASLGITGLKYIELFGGSDDASVLPPGSAIVAGETFFSSMQERAEVLSAKVEQTIDNLNALLSSENQRTFNELLNNAANLLTAANALVEDNRAALDETAANMVVASRSLAQASATVAMTTDSLHVLLMSTKLQQTVDDMHVAMHKWREQMDGPIPLLVARMDTLISHVDQTFVGIDQTVGASRQNLLRAIRELEETLQNIRETTELIRENPAVLIRGRSGEAQ
ncbi:MAG: MCE family protein [Gemmatimonadetes bacterium]|nr:MCE family protein [Gemmatimonadota bacterium]MXY82591.1 MCE family protein [Gemmatimonadota bacterium]MYA22272.1 MCE family protein [Gemmatimonadota bacterium]MYB67454.1 MCE family protein [Gemmatimonadota bacterium]